MKTILTEKVKAKVREYSRELRQWVSPERRKVKVQNLRAYLKGIGAMEYHRVCPNASLGQRFDDHGRPMITNLMRTNYSDESRFQWAIVYLIDEANDTVLVIDIIPASSVK